MKVQPPHLLYSDCSKIIKFVATRCQILKLKCTKFSFSWGSAPDPAGGALALPLNPLAAIGGSTSKGKGRGKGGRGGEGEGDGEMEGREGRGGEGDGKGAPHFLLTTLATDLKRKKY